MKFRKLIFWLHLVAGLVAGVIIAVMSLTGAALAFEKELVAWSERDVRRIAPPVSGAERLPVQDLLARVRERQPAGSPSAVTVAADPATAVLVSYGRTNTYFVNPYSGEVRETTSHRMRGFMQWMINCHRWLGQEGEGRDTGKAITGACNLAFLGLAISGLYLWWPRHWTAKHFRAIAVPSRKGHGKARDWNWHNALGFWAAPVLIVLTATALPISYRWAGDFIYTLTGTPKPAGATGPGPAASAPVVVPTPAPGSKPLGLEILLARVAEQVPNWEQMTLRLGAAPARGSGAGPREGRPAGGEGRGERSPAVGGSASSAGPEATRERGPAKDGIKGGSSANPVAISVKEMDGWPRFAARQFSLDPFTGAVLRQEGFAEFDRARQVRSWTRFLHTGEALGPVGQAVAGLASAIAGLLVWTGFALSWRRFFGRKSGASVKTPSLPEVAV